MRAVQSAKAAFNHSAANPAFGEVWLSGLLHGEERRAAQHVARQLCAAFDVPFSRGASCSENMSFLRDMLYELAKCAPTPHPPRAHSDPDRTRSASTPHQIRTHSPCCGITRLSL